MNPCYFGRSEAPLFGVYYPPKARPVKPAGVLLCYPGPEEYMRVHWVYRNLTQALIKAGFPVFKFDYYGTGDSAGNLGDGDVETWRADVETAAEEFRAMAGVKRLSLIGARLGAALAATLRELPGSTPVDDLILWDPVINGGSYVRELKTLQANRLAHSRYALERHVSAAEPELLGYPFRKRVEDSLATVDLLKQPLLACQRVTLVTSEPHPEYDLLARRMQEKNFQHHAVPDPCRWRTQELLEQAILPGRIVQKIAEVLIGKP